MDALMFTTYIFPPGSSNDWACNLHPVKYKILGDTGLMTLLLVTK